MEILKRSGKFADFDLEKIIKAMKNAFKSVGKPITREKLEEMALDVEKKIKENFPDDHIVTVEEIQDLVEIVLIENNFYVVVKSYILYRASHHKMRKVILDFEKYFTDKSILDALKKIQNDFKEDAYELGFLYNKFISFSKEGLNEDENLSTLIKAASELTSKEAPKWEYIAARLLYLEIKKEIGKNENRYELYNFYEKVKFLVSKNLYGKYILDEYSEEDFLELEAYMKEERAELLNYSGLDLIYKRYLIKDSSKNVFEDLQEMFMGIAMHLSIPEKENKVNFAKKLYDILSTLKITMATPTMTNARRPFHQLSSCFIDTVPDNLDGIYRSITNFSQVSKHGGGMGLYFGKVRAMGSDIRGFKGVAGGIIRWIKLVNDTAVAVDQLGVRQGACAVYLDVWHKDILEFLQVRTNNGDDRAKAHDIFPAVCFPDYFWHLAKNNIEDNWYMFCPHEVKTIMGFSLEDFYGKEWEEKYFQCINEPKLSRRVVSVKDMVRLIIKSQIETGTPFIFNRDIVNETNPNKHKGIIYCSNLCTEIAQNMSPIESISINVEKEGDEEVVVTKTKAGDFVVCNLASLVLGNINIDDKSELEEVIKTVVRALDNVIDLNYYPLPYAEITNRKYRAIGLGTSGYHHAMVKKGIAFSSEEHLKFADELYENINYFAIKASSEIAKEKGKYEYFEGSDWENGNYFELRGYNSDRWIKLKDFVKDNGLRNGYLIAIAPTGSTSIIAGTTAAVDPVMKRYYLEEKKGQIVPRVAPGLNPRSFWTYENAHEIDQKWVVKAAGVRQKHIDQSQSVNLYITTEYTMKSILNLYIRACEEKVKTIYYVRSKSLEVEACDSCSA